MEGEVRVLREKGKLYGFRRASAVALVENLRTQLHSLEELQIARKFGGADREKLVDYCIWRCVQQGSVWKEVSFPLAECSSSV